MFFAIIPQFMFVSYRSIGLLGTYPTIPEGEYFYLIFLILTRKVWIIFLSNISNNSFSLFILFFACMLICVQLYVSMTDSLQLHELQHARLLCPSLFPRVCSNSCPLSWWCYLTISSSASPFFCLHHHLGFIKYVLTVLHSLYFSHSLIFFNTPRCVLMRGPLKLAATFVGYP